MTQLDARAMLRRADARKLREDAGIRQVTVARAFGVPRHYVAWWESGRFEPQTQAGYRWAAFTAALERRAAFTAELDEAA